MELFEQPETIFEHISLIEECDNTIIRKYASLMLSMLFKSHLQVFSFEQALSVQDSLLELLTNDSDLYVQYFLCDSITTFLFVIENTPELWSAFSQNDQPWLNIFDLANNLVKDQNFLSTGLYLWRNIYSLFPNSGSNELLFALLSITTTSLSSPLESDRLQALTLFDYLRGCIPDQLGSESQAEVVQTSLQALLDELNYSIYMGYDDQEISLAIKVVAGFLDNPPPFLEFEHLSIFFELAFTVLTETSFPTMIRFMVHRIIESSVDMIVDNYRDRLNTLIQISVELSLEVCEQQPDDNNYEFPFSFFYTIVDAYDSETEGIFELFLSSANGLIFSTQDAEVGPAERQVALLIITSIVEGTQEIISERINDLIQFILQIADYDDPYVFASFCDTMNELIEYVSVPISLYIEDISSFVIQNIVKYTNDSILLLDNLFSKCGRAPKDTEPIFIELNQLINHPSMHCEQIEMIISCILSLLLQSDSPEEYVSAFLPTLNKIYQLRPDLKDVVFDFYGNIVSIAPNVVKDDLPNLTKMIMESLESTEDLQDDESLLFFSPAAICLKQIARVLPASLVSMSVVQESIPYFINLIDLDESDHFSIQNMDFSDENAFKHAQVAAISCIITFFGYMPNTAQKHIQEPFFDFLFAYVTHTSNLVSIYDSIADSVQGFYFLGVPLFDVIINSISKVLMFTEKKELIISILTMLAEVTRLYKTDIGEREDVLHIMISSMHQILTVPPLGFLKTEHSSYIDQQIQVPLFQYIKEFIIVLFELDINLSTNVLTGSLIPSLFPYLKSYSSIMKGHAIEALSTILFVLTMNIHLIQQDEPDEEEVISSLQQLSELVDSLMEIVVDAGFEIISQLQNAETRRIVANAFMFLVPIKRDVFADKLDILVPFSIELIEFNGFTGLWCVLAVCFSPQRESQEKLTFTNNRENSFWDFIQFLIRSHLDEEIESTYDFNMFDNLAVTAAVIDEIPGGNDVVSFEADFFFFIQDQINSISSENNSNGNDNDNNQNEAGNDDEYCNDVERISSLLEEKLPLIAVALFTANDNEFISAQNEVKLAFAQIISEMPHESLVELVNSNEAKLSIMSRHLRMIRTSQSSTE